MMDSNAKWRIVFGIAVVSIGLFLNIYGVSGFPNSPAMDWYIFFASGAGLILVGIGLILTELHEWDIQRTQGK
jgi:hypothetical membrane protein